MRMLTASVVANRRAIPVQTAAFQKSAIPRSQNSRENGFLNLLAMVVVVSYYDRRMCVEEQLCGTKGCRFGVKLNWTQFRRPEHLAHLSQLIGIAIMAWTAIGMAVVLANPSLQFNHPKKRPRFSLVTIGMRSREDVLLNHPLSFRNVVAMIPKPNLRNFPWIRLFTETI